MNNRNLYSAIIEAIFKSKYKPGTKSFEFEREEIVRFAQKLRVPLPKNLGDLVYSFRYRTDLPETIRSKAGSGESWIIKGAGRGKYRLALVRETLLHPNTALAVTKVPDSTPGVISKYALSDEQALLAVVRYNRLVDIFTGVACFSLQNHLRTTVPEIGQVETDEIYVGLDKKGVHYIFPVQAKGGKDKLNVIQVEQDMALCAHKFPSLVCRPIGAQFMQGDLISLFEFERSKENISITSERHYKLVPPEEVTTEDLLAYRKRISE